MAPPRVRTALLGGLALLAACTDAPRPGEAQRPVRLVLLTLDTLRHDAFTPERMPHTWAAARRGLRFARCYAATPTTQPTHATLFTGLDPWEHGVTHNGQVLGEDHRLLAEELADAGYHTEAVVSSYPLHGRFGFARGFERYDDRFSFERKPMPETWIDAPTVGEHFYSIADDTIERALAALDRAEERGLRRHFLWVHLFDAHSPYGDLEERPVAMNRLRKLAAAGAPELEATAERARSYYAGDVARLDRELGRLLERLRRDEPRYETHLVLTVDHGESFGEDGAWGHDARLTPEQLLVPTFVISPRLGDDAGTTSDEPLGTRDLHGALRRLARLEESEDAWLPADRRVEGMRRFRAGAAEPRFYRVTSEGLLSFDDRGVRFEDRSDAELDPAPHAELLERARLLHDELATHAARENRAPDSVRALEALGYGGS